jgi:hypothetical protein
MQEITTECGIDAGRRITYTEDCVVRRRSSTSLLARNSEEAKGSLSDVVRQGI